MRLLEIAFTDKPAGFFKHLCTKPVDLTVLLRDRNEYARRNNTSFLIPDTGQHFRTDHLIGFRINERLQIDFHFIMIDRMFQCTFDIHLMINLMDLIQIDQYIASADFPACLAECGQQTVEDHIYIFMICLGTDADKADIQEQVSFISAPGLLEPVCDLILHRIPVHRSAAKYRKTPVPQIKALQLRKLFRQVFTDQGNALVHLVVAVDLTLIGIIAQHKAENPVRPPLPGFLHHDVEGLPVQGRPPARGIQIRVLKRQIHDQDRHQAERIHDQILRHQITDDIAGQQDEIKRNCTDQFIAAEGVGIEPQKQQREKNIEDKCDINDVIKRSGMIAHGVNIEDITGEDRHAGNKLRNQENGAEQHFDGRESAELQMQNVHGIQIKPERPRIEQQKIQQIHQVEKPDRHRCRIGVCFTRNQIKYNYQAVNQQ